MGCHVVDRWGGTDADPTVDRMREVLAELADRDPEHPDAWLTHDESGWTLTAYETGQLVIDNAAQPRGPRHMSAVPRERVLSLWQRLAAGDLAEIEREPWQPGHGIPPLTAAERAERAAEHLAYERSVYDSFGTERAESPCRALGCSRGAVVASVFCRTHHFEQVFARPCPFRD